MATAVETRPTRGAELLGLVAFAIALMLLIALATFDPRDPAPFFKAGVEGPARNFIGPFGAFLAEMLIPQLFGLASLLLPLVLGLLGWKLFWCKPIDAPYTKTVGNLVLLLSLAGLLSLAVGTVCFEGEPVRAGGAVGEIVSGLLVADFSRTGAYILCATALFVALILATQFSFSTLPARARAGGSATASARSRPRGPTIARAGARRSCAATSSASTPEARDADGGLPRIRKVKAGFELDGESEAATNGVASDDPDDLPLHAPLLRAAAPTQKPLPFAVPAEDDGDEGPRPAGSLPPTPKAPPRPRLVPVRRRGTGELHPAPDHDPRRGQGRAPRSTTTACSRRAASSSRSAASSG